MEIALILTSSIFIILSGIFNAAMDITAHKYKQSIFSIYNKYKFFSEDSWKNKYKNYNKDDGERFFGSTTFLVFLTDFWHFCQFMWINFMILGCLLYQPNIFNDNNIIDIILYFLYTRIIYLISFNLFYNYIFKLKQ